MRLSTHLRPFRTQFWRKSIAIIDHQVDFRDHSMGGQGQRLGVDFTAAHDPGLGIGGHAVHRALHIGEQREGALRAIAHTRRKVGVEEQLANVAVRTVRMVTVFVVLAPGALVARAAGGGPIPSPRCSRPRSCRSSKPRPV